ncbi:glycosyltransferase family 4 protein [Microbacterium invictum]|uniref:Glycosyltransferase involved in cell wall biosynthesis n=1 Tax=Microbacterium invictum TaxID=515415 RepID=A0AA40SPS0_9MICO|nr:MULTISPECIES: glycosyltransferase family 1 protein [Microbacterium]MBB4140138.1 glycosyltransferase involved in cell wall biosynthesis [Microbacterium invictum]
MTDLYVDDRYRGAHGIGRYAREVLSRLRPQWRPLDLDGSPHSPLDAFRPLPALGAESLVYSPGYGALVRAPRQVLTIHDLIQLRSPWPGRAKFAAYYAGPVRHTVRKAGVVLTVSETSAREIREWLRDDAVRVVNAGNGCSAAFHPEGPSEHAADPYVVFVGNTRRHKNLDVVLQALALAPDVRLRAVVPEREVEDAAVRAAARGVADRVDWLHGIDDARLAALYRGAAATVMPSTLEGFGLPALESIACGVPVIFWRGCESVAEIVGDRGWALGSAMDAGEWAAALTEADAAPRRVEPPHGVYDWDRTAGVVSGVLESKTAS